MKRSFSPIIMFGIFDLLLGLGGKIKILKKMSKYLDDI